eukprot:c12950_g2_i1.p1 GENE.c12950_g2_i1~~c12950_g2_i1.p1  ORF type:complete len:403 (+),score=119.87 c12950_g2_i1:78-1211(+)
MSSDSRSHVVPPAEDATNGTSVSDDDSDNLDAILDQALEDFDNAPPVIPISPVLKATPQQPQLPQFPPLPTPFALSQQQPPPQQQSEQLPQPSPEDIMNMMGEFWKFAAEGAGDEKDNNAQDISAEEKQLLERMDALLKTLVEEAVKEDTSRPQDSQIASSSSPATSSSNTTSTSNNTKPQSSSSTQPQPPTQQSQTPADEIHKNVLETLKMMTQSAQQIEEENQYAGGASSTDAAGLDEASQSLATAFEKLIGGLGSEDSPELEGMFETVINQLMSKDLMYGPMKEACDKYPEWLERNKNNSNIARDQYEKYQQQYTLLQQLVLVYERTPNDSTAIFELMEQISQCGQPPSELVEALGQGQSPDLSNIDPANCSVM